MPRHSHRPAHAKQVRFRLPDDHNDAPPGILRKPTKRPSDLVDLSLPTRRASLPSSVGGSRLRSREARLRGLEALQGLRSYLKDACNFHGEELRRALSVPSVDALCSLIAFVNALRAGTTPAFNPASLKRDERTLRALIDCAARHPHEQLAAPEPHYANVHERHARRAHRKRARREADHRLLHFTAKQLKLPARLLRELSTSQREQRELDAFKARLTKFNGPRASAANSSAPQSPADRALTAPRSPITDPVRWEQLHGKLSGTKDELFPPMEELNLPGSYYDTAGSTPRAPAFRNRPVHNVAHSPYNSVYAAQSAAPSYAPPGSHTPPQQPMPSPYAAVPRTPPQTYQQSPYHHPQQTPSHTYSPYPGSSVTSYPRTPPQAPPAPGYGAAPSQPYVPTTPSQPPLPHQPFPQGTPAQQQPPYPPHQGSTYAPGNHREAAPPYPTTLQQSTATYAQTPQQNTPQLPVDYAQGAAPQQQQQQPAAAYVQATPQQTVHQPPVSYAATTPQQTMHQPPASYAMATPQQAPLQPPASYAQATPQQLPAALPQTPHQQPVTYVPATPQQSTAPHTHTPLQQPINYVPATPQQTTTAQPQTLHQPPVSYASTTMQQPPVSYAQTQQLPATYAPATPQQTTAFPAPHPNAAAQQMPAQGYPQPGKTQAGQALPPAGTQAPGQPAVPSPYVAQQQVTGHEAQNGNYNVGQGH